MKLNKFKIYFTINYNKLFQLYNDLHNIINKTYDMKKKTRKENKNFIVKIQENLKKIIFF